MSLYHVLSKSAYAGYDRPMGSYNGAFQMPRGGPPPSQDQMRKMVGTGDFGLPYNGPPQANPYQNINPAQPQNPVQQTHAQDWQSAPGVKPLTDTSGSWFQKNVVDNPWLEGAAGLATMIPVVGGAINGAWQGGRAAYHTAQGNYGKAGEAAAWGALGFVPGGGVLRGAKLGLGGVKALHAGNTFRTGVNAVRGAEAAAKWAVPTAKSVGFGAKATGVGKSIAGGALDMGAAAGVGAAVPNFGAGSQYAADNAAVKPVTDMSSYGANMISQGIAENRRRAGTQ